MSFLNIQYSLVITVSPKFPRCVPGTQLARGEVSPSPFLKIREKCPDFAKKNSLILEKSALFACVYDLNSHLKMRFSEYLGEKTPKLPPAWQFFCILYMKRLSTCPQFKKIPLSWKIPGCGPVFIILSNI